VAIVTTDDVPISLVNQVTIVPSGLIGEQYVDLTSIKIEEQFLDKFNYDEPHFISLEPIRLDSLIRVNLESSEAIKNLANRVNAVFGEEDADNIKNLIKASNSFVNDPQLRRGIKESAENIRKITEDFSFWNLLFGIKKKAPSYINQ
jgi:ABC-type transporter Mla subunit MlaD